MVFEDNLSQYPSPHYGTAYRKRKYEYSNNKSFLCNIKSNCNNWTTPPPPPGHPTRCANQPPCSLQVANSFIKLLKLLCVKSQFSNLQTVRNIRKAISATQRVKERADSEKESARDRERSERESAHCVYAWYAVWVTSTSMWGFCPFLFRSFFPFWVERHFAAQVFQ